MENKEKKMFFFSKSTKNVHCDRCGSRDNTVLPPVTVQIHIPPAATQTHTHTQISTTLYLEILNTILNPTHTNLNIIILYRQVIITAL